MSILNHSEILPADQQWGTAIEKLRQDQSLSRAQLAVAADIGVGSLQRVEQGKQPPSLRTFITLCEVLGVSLDWLLEEALRS